MANPHFQNMILWAGNNEATEAKKDQPMFMPYPSDQTFYGYFNDFVQYNASDWTITTTEAGGGSASEGITSGAGGQLLISNDDAASDSDFLQLKGEPFKLSTSKRAYFSARFKVNDVDQNDFIIGLQITDTTPLDVSDGVYFISVDGSADLLLNVDDIIRSKIKHIRTTPKSSYSGVATEQNQTNINKQETFDKVTSLFNDHKIPVSIIDVNLYNHVSAAVKSKPTTGVVAIYDVLVHKPKSIFITGFKINNVPINPKIIAVILFGPTRSLRTIDDRIATNRGNTYKPAATSAKLRKGIPPKKRHIALPWRNPRIIIGQTRLGLWESFFDVTAITINKIPVLNKERTSWNCQRDESKNFNPKWMVKNVK